MPQAVRIHLGGPPSRNITPAIVTKLSRTATPTPANGWVAVRYLGEEYLCLRRRVAWKPAAGYCGVIRELEESV